MKQLTVKIFLRGRPPRKLSLAKAIGCSSSIMRFWVLLLIPWVFASTVRAEVLDPGPMEAYPESQETGQEKENDDYWIRINPGFILSSTSIKIDGLGYRSGSNAHMVSKNRFGKPDWMLDIKSEDYPLTKHWGIHVLAHTRSFDLGYQEYTDVSTSEDGTESSQTVTEDLGTRMRGYYALTVPVLYYNFNGRENGGKIGLGYGPSIVRMQGSASLDSGITTAPLFLSQDRDTLVRDLQINTIVQGSINFQEGDPFYGALLLGLQQPGGLERMGAYLIARGDVKADLYTVFLINYLTSGQAPGDLQLTLAEAIGAVALANLNVDFREDFAPSYFLFGEYSWEHLTLRLAMGGPIFDRDGFKYDLTGIILSVSFPIRF